MSLSLESELDGREGAGLFGGRDVRGCSTAIVSSLDALSTCNKVEGGSLGFRGSKEPQSGTVQFGELCIYICSSSVTKYGIRRLPAIAFLQPLPDDRQDR